MRLRHLVTIGPRPPIGTELHPDADVTFVPMEAIADGLGGLDISQTRPFSEVASGSYNYFAEGDLLLAKVTPCFENGKKALAQSLSNGIGYATSEVHVIRPGVDRIHPKYLFYLLCSEDFRAGGIASMTGAGGLRRVSDAAVLNYQPSVTNLPTQKAIADFLDRETARIDQLIEKKQRMVDVLEEKIRATTKCISFGQDKFCARKVNRFSWLPDLPEHWDILRTARLFQNLDSERVPLSEIERADLEKRYPYYGASGQIDFVDRYIFDEDLILVGEDGANLVLQSTPIAFIARGKYWVNNHAHILKPKDCLLDFWTHMLNQVPYASFVSGSAQPKLTREALGNILLPVPPVEERKAIAVKIESQVRETAKVRPQIKISIDRLREIRSALITAAVTGQIEVSTWGKQGTTRRRLDQIEEATSA